MGKKQHQKDKLYLTTKEWKDSFGGHKSSIETQIQKAQFKKLPFTHCALTFLPYQTPVCTPSGVIFDKQPILDYLKKHKINPVDGKKLEPKDLIELHMSKDSDGNYQCPVTFRTFTESSLIVTIRTTGNVYAMEAVEELNLKRAHLKDLLNDVPFQRKDIITLQNPNDLEKFNIERFYHVQFDTRTLEEIAEEKKQMQSASFYINKLNSEAKSAIQKLNQKYEAKKEEEKKDVTADAVNAAHYSQGKMAAGLTSTVMEPITVNKAAVLDESTVKYSRVTKNGYVRLLTNHGPLNLELFCKIAPKACENFIRHCADGYYDNSRFHRLIKHFMLQGGDPTGTGKGGESVWGKPFEDEVHHSLHHDARGVLSMANRGTDTNQSQFFITFRPCRHLDGKHTIFGKLVGGLPTLASIERVETDKNDAPLEPVVFIKAEVFVNPFEEAEAQVLKEREEALGIQKEKKSVPEYKSTGYSGDVPKPKAHSAGVGKYIRPDVKTALKRIGDVGLVGAEPKQKQKKNYDFSDW
ncbi:unnamed protein product [Bursaphelenchus xylophilus]|uniref:(pine wood nematode) hypothetical protein n=1 Tax=Bursaphelenchus xylophilus TaxID=6326 RepID=A0A7I8WYL4_BURXY|nr:unnamed protein product [Bursaphelenchus xylophilus]CAG9101342.1 unnamed protein product [Bursaphelenchus xylophilus]